MQKKCKISFYGLLDLQIALCIIKMNSKDPVIYQKNNLVITVKFRPLT